MNEPTDNMSKALMPPETLTPEYAAACQHVYETLSKINVNEHAEEKNGLTYLSWAWAYQTMMEQFPTFDYRILESRTHKDGTVTVRTLVWVIHDGQVVSKFMWLPVMTGYSNKAVTDPNSRQVSDTTMRCITKAMSMLGLGAYIYAGEDLPKGEDAPAEKPKQQQKPKPQQQAKKKAQQKKQKPKPEPKPDASDKSDYEESVVYADIKEEGVVYADIPEGDTESAKEVADMLIQFAGMHGDSVRNLAEFWKKNKKVIDVLDTRFNDEYQRVKAEFTELKQKTQEQSENE